MSDLTPLAGHDYLSLQTRRKDGRTVATPVWFALEEGVAYAFTMADSGKVKRLRNFSQSKVAPCDVRGKLVGEWLDTETVILAERDEQERARRALRRKYKVQMAVTDLFGTVTGRIRRRAYLAIRAA
ncbi:MAG: PPOX class F420-dependent oxidoreductase [Acidobacteria bacterium]|nr:MAG: PPOX class F420-dependent oxidoreductase [Acidobacteriota bacterium]REK05859.1 MAG: PPOX class F420-dependent oxidoreductase [Acidobacteriota bacterium]